LRVERGAHGLAERTTHCSVYRCKVAY
jgi:hypothetical protein